MRKIIYRLIFCLLLIISILIVYLSLIGIKTERFNNLIVSKINKVDSNLNLRINQIHFKLSPFSLKINLKTLGADLIYRNKNIKLESVKSQISIKSLINNQFALSEVIISTKSIPIKNLLSLVKAINNDPRLLLAQKIIDKGFIIADLQFKFDEDGKIRKNFKVDGLVNNAQLSLLKKKISKLNFTFQITDQELTFKNLIFLLNNKKLTIPQLKAKKRKNEFLFSGSLNNENLILKKNEINKFINNKFLNTYFDNISFNSNSDFTFKIDRKFKIKDLNIKSAINIDKLEISNFLDNKSFFPKIREVIKFEKQKINLNYNENKIDIKGSGNVFLQKNLDIISYKILNNNGNYSFNLNFKINDNPFIIEPINFEKNIKSNLDLMFEGYFKKNILSFKEISLSENNNTLSISNLKLTDTHKIEKVGNIKLNFIDNDNKKNELEITKVKEYYRIIGNNFNANKLITKLLDSKNEDKKNFFAKNFKVKIGIKKVNLDENNIIR